MYNKKKKGISLIVLIITIVVILILGTTILLVIKKNNIISNSREAVFKEDIINFKSELIMSVGKQYSRNDGQRDKKINARSYVKDGSEDSIYVYIPDLKKEYEEKLVIVNDELCYIANKVSDEEKKWLDELKIKQGPILPDVYVQVEYIESSGEQYINTKIVPTIDTAMEISLAVTDSNSSSLNWCGSVLIGNQGWFAVGSYSFNSLVAYFSVDNRAGATIDFDTNFHEYYISNGCQKIDNVEYSNTITEFKNKMLEIYFFKGNNNFSRNTTTKQKIKYAKIFENNKLIHYFIPCYTKDITVNSNGKSCDPGTAGMYDVIEKKFYTNDGTGEFIKGKQI